ncbi:hypothetical protein GCM10010289_04010 [Streptomyces violascens]|uniref:Uncharacterized protein n=1 Tax=Streptomyces violascens TaxID=67381 RepID=A0ABQ3QFK7_9ACTN|nr:hypothetical protein GCM10010289_04010 [Streptomyces violascens]GHI36067.1 hypothetical protein Sviol_04750 [Streptomyces violascens]
MIEAETLEPVHVAKATQPGADGSREGVSAGGCVRGIRTARRVELAASARGCSDGWP